MHETALHPLTLSRPTVPLSTSLLQASNPSASCLHSWLCYLQMLQLSYSPMHAQDAPRLACEPSIFYAAKQPTCTKSIIPAVTCLPRASESHLLRMEITFQPRAQGPVTNCSSNASHPYFLSPMFELHPMSAYQAQLPTYLPLPSPLAIFPPHLSLGKGDFPLAL